VSRKHRTGSKLKTTILLLMVPASFILALNLFWLRYSTTRISIEGHGLASVQLNINDEVIDLGNLRRGESRFMFLPKSETALYSITYKDGGVVQSVCNLEVAGTKRHVDARLYGGQQAACTVEEPLFSDLMVRKFF
jgi:hypothetical protein